MVDLSRITLMQFYKNYYMPDKHPDPEANGNTRGIYRNDIHLINRFWRIKQARDITVGDLSDFTLLSLREWLMKCGRKPATCNRVFRQIKAIWRFAIVKGCAIDAPTVRQMKEPKREPECWSLEEYQSIIVAARALSGKVGGLAASVFWPGLLQFTYATGVRITAVMTVPAGNLDLSRGEVLIPYDRQKQRAEQRFHLLPSAVASLKKMKVYERGLDTIFGDWTRDRTQPSWPTLNKHLRKIIVQAGLRKRECDVTRRDLWHKGRRTFATMLAASAGRSVASACLGHASEKTTEFYLDRRYLPEVRVSDVLPDPDPLVEPYTPDDDEPFALAVFNPAS